MNEGTLANMFLMKMLVLKQCFDSFCLLFAVQCTLSWRLPEHRLGNSGVGRTKHLFWSVGKILIRTDVVGLLGHGTGK